MIIFEILPSKKESMIFTEYFGVPPVLHSETLFECVNPPKEDGFPKVKELITTDKFISDRKDPNYDRPISDLEKEY